MTADDLFHNWARCEWQGELPHPLPPSFCASAERHYMAPAVSEDDGDRLPPPNWTYHALVHFYYTDLPLLNQRILQMEYTRRYQFGDLGRNGRQEKAARMLQVSVHRYRNMLEQMKSDIEKRWRGI